jgi:hypothetical protein
VLEFLVVMRGLPGKDLPVEGAHRRSVAGHPESRLEVDQQLDPVTSGRCEVRSASQE